MNNYELWNKNSEIKFFKDSLHLTTKEQLFYKTQDGKYVAYWPNNYVGKRTTLQSRNSFIGNFTEKWVVDLLKDYVKSKNLHVIQGVICNDLELHNRSPADVAICKTNDVVQRPENIVLIIEIKMSVVWNWEYKNDDLFYIGDYTTHKGNPSLLRSDTMLKAIGKSINVRFSSEAGGNIPIIIMGNTPITNSYYQKVDQLKKKGLIQGFWSINPEPKDSGKLIKNTPSKGFINMYSYNELIEHLDVLLEQSLNQKLVFISSLISKQDLGKLIEISNNEDTWNNKAEKLLDLMRDKNG